MDITSELGLDLNTPILFLDIDGVLNSHRWWEVRPQGDRAAKSALTRELSDLCPRACALFEELYQELRFNVVISSSWRKTEPLAYIEELFRHRGITAPLLGITPVIWVPAPLRQFEHGRGCEIQFWLRTYRALQDMSIAILDDDGDMSCLRPRLVQTSMSTGLLPKHLPRVRDLLSLPLGEHVWAVDALSLDARFSY